MFRDTASVWHYTREHCVCIADRHKQRATDSVESVRLLGPSSTCVQKWSRLTHLRFRRSKSKLRMTERRHGRRESGLLSTSPPAAATALCSALLNTRSARSVEPTHTAALFLHPASLPLSRRCQHCTTARSTCRQQLLSQSPDAQPPTATRRLLSNRPIPSRSASAGTAA